MFRRFFGFGSTEPAKPAEKTAENDNWIINDTLQRYEVKTSGYNYRTIPEIIDANSRSYNDFYIGNAVELSDITTYDLKGAKLMIDGSLTIRKEVTFLNGTIDLMYGTGIRNREHELKMDHDFTFTNGIFVNVYAIRHFMNDLDDNMKGTLEDIHGLSTINGISAAEIIAVHGNPSLLRESLKTGNRSSQGTTIIKDLEYNYELILIQDSADLQNVHIYGDTIQMSTEDAAPKILSSTNNATISCNNLQFLSKMTIQGVEIHANKITFASSLDLTNVGIVDCTLYNKLLLTADTIKVFKGNTVFVEGFCVQVEDNKTVEIGMKMYNKGDMNGKNKAIENFATVNGGSINIVRKTLHDNFERVYQTTSEYITEYLKEGEKYTLDNYVNYDVYIQWLNECVTKFGSFNIAEYKIGNTTYKENKSINEFIELLKSKSNVQKVEVNRAATSISAYQFQFQHYTNGNKYYVEITCPFSSQTNSETRSRLNSSQFFETDVVSNTRYGSECTTLIKLKRAILYDLYRFIVDNARSTVDSLKTFVHECEIIAKCEIRLRYGPKYNYEYSPCEWLTVEEYINKFNNASVVSDCIHTTTTAATNGLAFVTKDSASISDMVDILPLRYDMMTADDNLYPYLVAQFIRFKQSYKERLVEIAKNAKPRIADKRLMYYCSKYYSKIDFLTVEGKYPYFSLNTPRTVAIQNPARIYDIWDNYYGNMWNVENDDITHPKVTSRTTTESLFDTYENILNGMSIEESSTELKNLLGNGPLNTLEGLEVVRDAFSRFIALKTDNTEYYKCTLTNSGTEIEKSLLELDNVGSANSVTNVMTEHTMISMIVPLHTQSEDGYSYASYYTNRLYSQNGERVKDIANIWFNKTDEELLEDLNQYFTRITKVSTADEKKINDDDDTRFLQYAIETQFYARKKIYLKSVTTGEYVPIDNIKNKTELLDLLVINDDIPPSSGMYTLKTNEPKLVEETSIPLHSKEFEFTREYGEDTYTTVTPINTLDPTVRILFRLPENLGGSTTYTYPNPWFEELSTETGIEADIERWKEGPTDAKWRREYMAELLYFAQQPVFFSTASTGGGSFCDPFRLPVDAASPNVILPLRIIKEGLYAYIISDENAFIKSEDYYFANNERIFSLPCHPEAAVSPIYAKEAFNMCIAKYLEGAKLADTEDGTLPRTEEDIAAGVTNKRGTVNSDIMVKLSMQYTVNGEVQTKWPLGEGEISLREHFDTLYDELLAYYSVNVPDGVNVTCGFTANLARVVPYRPLEILHANLDEYKDVEDEITHLPITPMLEVAKEDYSKVYQISDNHSIKREWLKECEWKLPGDYKAYIMDKGMENEIEFWKFIPVEILLSHNSEIRPKDAEHPEESILLADRYFLTKLVSDRLECFEENPEDIENPQIDPAKEKAMLNSQIRYMFQFCKNDFLEMAKQLLLFYCVKDGKIYRDIKLTFNRQETVVIIRKGVKTVKLTEESQSIGLLELIVAVESSSEDIVYNTVTLPEEGNVADFGPLASDYVYPPFIVADETYQTDGNLDKEKCIVNVLRAYKELSNSFANDDKYKYGLEGTKYRYVQRDVLAEINEIFNQCNKNQISSETGKTKEFKGPVYIVGISPEDDTLQQVLTVGLENQMNYFVREGAGIMSIYEVSVDDSLSISVIKRIMTDDGVTRQDLNASLSGISAFVVAEALKILKYTDGKWDIKYSEDQQKSVNDFINEPEHSDPMMGSILLVRRKEGVQLPLVTDEAMEDVIAYLNIKKNEYGDDIEGFKKYANDFLLELKQKENEQMNYFYFIIHTDEEEEETHYETIEFVPRCKALDMVEKFVSMRSISDCEFIEVSYPAQVVHLSDDPNGLIEKCKIEYTNERHTPKTYIFWPMDFISYAAVLSEATLELSEINNNNFVYFTTENLVNVAQEMEGVSVFLRRGIDNPDVVTELRTEAANGAIEYFVYWENEDEEVYSAVKELKEKIARYISGNITADNFKLYLYEWQLKCAYLSYDQQTEKVEKTQGVALTPVTFKLMSPEEGHQFHYVDLLPYDTIDTLLGATDDELRNTLSTRTEILPIEYRIQRENDIIPDGPEPGPNPDDGGEEVPDDDDKKDMYVLSDEDQNETRGWIYTGLIKRLLEKYFSGSLMGDETSWANITNRTMMSNEEMSNIMTLLNTRYQSEIKKANSDDKYEELKEILLPEGEGDEIGVADLINTILTREQDYNRDKVRYSLEERNELMQVMEDWYNYYKPNIKTFIDEAEIMIWEGMDLEYYTKVDTFEDRVDDIVKDYNYIYNKVNNTKVTWKKVRPTNLDVYFCVCDFTDPRNDEWPQFMNEIEAIRNSWERYSDTNGKILVCIGNNYGEIWSVLGKQPGNNIPIETYFYLKSQTNGCARQLRRCMHPPAPPVDPEPEPTESLDRRIIYIPKDRADSNINWSFDDYYITKLYQLLFDPFYLTINDSSNFKDFVNPIADAKIYLGYVVIAP